MRYFGQAWSALMLGEIEQVPTPVGKECLLCEEPIRDDDRGFMVPHLTGSLFEEKPNHRECLARSIFGGIEHLAAPLGHPIGTCYDNSTLSYRESSLQAWEWLQKNKGIGDPPTH